MPGLADLCHDYFDPAVEVTPEDYYRRLLGVFKDSPDQTYEKLLAKHTDAEQKRVEQFLSGKHPEDICDGFQLGPSLGAREELQQLAKARVFKVSAADGAVDLETLSSETHEHHDVFHKVLHGLADLFRRHDHQDELLVHIGPPEVYPSLTDTQPGLQKCRVSQLGPEPCPDASVHLCA